jgi:uncharacterized membrane protein YeiH
MQLTFNNIVEIIGIVAFALSGALSAIQKKLDIFGVLVLTFVTAIGGGTVRDLIIGSLPVAWLLDLELITAMTVSFFIALFFNNRIQSYPLLMFWFDSIGLAFFCMVAIDKGIAFNFHPIICIALGTITGSFGGIIRDVLLNEIPYVFRKDVYASACIAGGILYFILLQFIQDTNLASLISGALIILIRVGARFFNWQMPNIYK